jgi:hypothetical protein
MKPKTTTSTRNVELSENFLNTLIRIQFECELNGMPDDGNNVDDKLRSLLNDSGGFLEPNAAFENIVYPDYILLKLQERREVIARLDKQLAKTFQQLDAAKKQNEHLLAILKSSPSGADSFDPTS